MGALRIVGVALIIAGIVGLALGIAQNSGALQDLYGVCTPSDGGSSCVRRDWVKSNPAAASFLWSFMSFGILWGPGLLIAGGFVLFGREEGPAVPS